MEKYHRGVNIFSLFIIFSIDDRDLTSFIRAKWLGKSHSSVDFNGDFTMELQSNKIVTIFDLKYQIGKTNASKKSNPIVFYTQNFTYQKK